MKRIFLLLYAGLAMLCAPAKAQQNTGKHFTCTDYNHLPDDLKKVFTLLQKARISGDSLGLTFPLDTHYWTKKDVFQLGTNYLGLGGFYELYHTAGGAIELTSDKSDYTFTAKCAQKVLTQLKPYTCKTWEDFYSIIQRVYAETKVQRQRIENEHPDIYESHFQAQR